MKASMRQHTAAAEQREADAAMVGFEQVAGMRLTFVQFMQLCEDRGVIPACLAPNTLEHIFRCVCVCV